MPEHVLGKRHTLRLCGYNDGWIDANGKDAPVHVSLDTVGRRLLIDFVLDLLEDAITVQHVRADEAFLELY